MMWTVYELLLNLYQGTLYTWFITKMLSPKSNAWLPFLICALLTAFGFSTYMFLPMPSSDNWVFIFILIYSFVFLNGNIPMRLFWVLILIVLTSGTIGILYQLFYLIFGTDIDVLLLQNSMRIISTLSVNFILWLVLFTVVRLFSRRDASFQPSSLLLVTLMLCAALIDLFFHLINQYEIPLVWLFTGCLIAVSIGIMTMITYQLLIHYTHVEQEYYFQKEMLEESEKRALEMKEVYGSTLKLRHDMRAFVKDIQEMAEHGELRNVPRYLNEMEKEVAPLYSSGNQALDSVLMVKLSKAKAEGIVFKGTNLHYTGGMNIRDAALCSLISNMLDNAIEALKERNDREGERYISLSFRYSPAGLTIICENSLLGISPKMIRTSFLSKKVEPYHGLGISIMKRILEEAEGTFEVSVSDDLFRVFAIIPPSADTEVKEENIQ